MLIAHKLYEILRARSSAELQRDVCVSAQEHQTEALLAFIDMF